MAGETGACRATWALSVLLLLVFALIGAYAVGYKNGVDDMAELIFGPPVVIQPQTKPKTPERSAYWRSEDEQPLRTFWN